ATERFPNIPETYFFLSITARAKGDFDLAVKSLRKSLALKPENPDATALLGAILADQSEIAEGEKLLRQAAGLDKNHFNAHYDLGRLLIRNRRYEEALPFLQRAASLKPDNPDVHYQLFLTLSRLKRQPEAAQEFAIYKKITVESKNQK
ncbi:MAG: tetratricopeptide repeat protein, partial [Acidobacteria bacterium]|nr:tetratricopeptide repeat protein [Acidobacteriota bacterium]